MLHIHELLTTSCAGNVRSPLRRSTRTRPVAVMRFFLAEAMWSTDDGPLASRRACHRSGGNLHDRACCSQKSKQKKQFWSSTTRLRLRTRPPSAAISCFPYLGCRRPAFFKPDTTGSQARVHSVNFQCKPLGRQRLHTTPNFAAPHRGAIAP
jgi:hypothetical protein